MQTNGAKLKVGESRNQCQACKQYFNSNTAFDFHRTGEHGVDRRCMTVEEMLGRGMEINQAGYWIKDKFTRKFKHE
jgi:hypothetical protein